MVTQARAFTTRALIVKGAAIAFERYGYDGASLNDVVESAGTTKGALYFHFKTKEALALEVVAEHHRRTVQAVHAIESANGSGLRRIVMICHDMARQIIDDPLVRAGLRVTLELSVSEGPHHPLEVWTDACVHSAELAIRQGDLRGELDPAGFGRFLIAAFTGVQLLSEVHTGRADLRDRVDEMLRILLSGLMPPRRRSRLDTALADSRAADEPADADTTA